MSSATSTAYPAGLIPTIAAELLARVAAAERAGVRRWRIVLDPGIGFAKTAEGNLEILRGLRELRAAIGLHGLPWLVGCSRKGFVGRVLGGDDVRRAEEGRRRRVSGCGGDGEQGGGEGSEVRDVGDRDWGTAATVSTLR